MWRRPDMVYVQSVPDLRLYAERFLDEAAEDGLGIRSRLRTPIGSARRLFGNPSHLRMLEEGSLRSELQEAGFTRIRRAQTGDCVDSMFKRVEEPDRFIDGVAMEADR